MGTKSATPAIAACAAAGIEHTVHHFPHSDGHFGEDAAHWLGEHLGVEAGRIHKTLVIELHGKRTGLAVAIVPVTGRLNLKAAAKALGASKAELADPAAAQRSSGYVVGGISPLGQKRALPTVLDAGAGAHATIFVSGGRRGLDIELAPADLAALTGAASADIAD
ncbi:aminoacyl-tRNA deacylase [Corynebacterium sp. NPDC060344]|uniref:aminoacyl-tRNA deacylase n=1 Tax=Corynebacterium sp. NPDC060344 TaxID=3347101 RepID=UPI00364CB087